MLFRSGFTDAHIYPLVPDVAEARRLAGRKRRRVVLYTCSDSQCKEGAQIVKTNLAAIGMDVVVKTFRPKTLFDLMKKPGEPFDIAASGWEADYPDPSQFLNLQLSAASQPSFDDPAFKSRLAKAARLSGPVRYITYGKLDVDLARNGAPWVAIGSTLSRDFFSARVGCQVFQPAYGFMDLGALCIRK